MLPDVDFHCDLVGTVVHRVSLKKHIWPWILAGLLNRNPNVCWSFLYGNILTGIQSTGDYIKLENLKNKKRLLNVPQGGKSLNCLLRDETISWEVGFLFLHRLLIFNAEVQMIKWFTINLAQCFENPFDIHNLFQRNILITNRLWYTVYFFSVLYSIILI